jgi:hypothetical protein
MTSEVTEKPKAWRAFEADPLEGMAQGPYPGLRPFLPRERDIFFGREQMIDQVLVRLNEQHMVVVHGASGCGKSSLIAAGVLPQLARRRARRRLVLKTGTFRPGIQPMQSLVGLLGELCGTEAGPAPIDAVYRAISGGAGVARAGVARLAADAGVDQLCIVIDQFEELFRFAEDEGYEEAQRFADLLVQLCGGGDGEGGWWDADGAARPAEPVPAEISFILTMRSEFLGNCSRYPGLAEAINRTQYLLPNMGRDDLIRAIREPAEVFEGNVEHQLAERMADDALREEDSLPLIQHALMQMWLASETGRLGLADYEHALEGSAQSDQAKQKGPLGAILAGHADRVLADTTGGDPATESAVEFIFRALTRKDSESRAIRFPQRFWRLARLSGLGEDGTRAIVDGFRRDTVSFLTPYAAMTPAIDGETVIDISHEALIRTWPRMSDKGIDDQARPIGWIEREAQDAMLWRWLAVHADFFRANPRAYLDGATTERLGAWFERIRERPDWVRPYLVKPTGKADVTEEPEWQAVVKLLKESHDRNWLDRLRLKRWRKLGWASLALALLIALVAIVSVKLIFRENAAGDAIDAARGTVAQALRVTDDFIGSANEPKLNGRPEQTERVPDQIAAQATAGTGGVVTDDNATQAYIWVGTTYADGRPAITNLVDAGGRAVAPDRANAATRPRTAQNLALRASFPDDGSNIPARALGLIARGTPVTILDRVAVARDDRTDHWAQVSLTPPARTPVSFAFGGDTNGAAAAGFTGLFGDLGYRATPAQTAAGAAGPAPGTAEALYCRDRDRDAAFQLAIRATNWLSRVPGMAGAVVVPRLDPDCAEGAPPLTLRVAFLPSPIAWLNGRWTPDGNCAHAVTIQVQGQRLVVRSADAPVAYQTILNTNGDVVVTDQAYFMRMGDRVTASETQTALTFNLRRCPG